MEAGLELRQHAAVAHALDTLALVALGNVGADERERHGVEPLLQHGVHVVDQFARDGVLVGGDAEFERAHRPLDGRPVQRGEARADAEGALAKLRAGRRKDRRGGSVLLDEVFQTEQVFECGGKRARLAGERHAVGQHGGALHPGARFQQPGAVARRDVLDQLPGARLCLKAAFDPFFRPGAACFQLPGQNLPIEAEVRRHAGILRDAEIMLQQERVDGGHRLRFELAS